MIRFRLLAFALASMPVAAAAETVKFCIEHTGSYVDSGIAGLGVGGPEDFWTGNGQKLARGAFTEVAKGGVGLWSGFLGDGMGAGDPGVGCTATINVATANGTYELTVSSYGTLNSNYVNAYDEDGFLRAATATYPVTTGSGQTHTVEMNVADGTAWDVLNVYQTGAYALWRHNGGNVSQDFDFYVGPNLNTSHSTTLSRVNINSSGANPNSEKKFIIVHEMGHHMEHLRTQGLMNAAQDYIYYWAACQAETASGGDGPAAKQHSMRSKEESGAAAGEGFAHFYAADVWNSDAEADCWFEYYKPVPAGGDETPEVDCESANGNFPPARLETDCSGGEGVGVELDWLRQYWDVHTNGAAPDPSFFDIMDWLDGANDIDDTNAFQALDASANREGGELNTNWDSVKAFNGVDH